MKIDYIFCILKTGNQTENEKMGNEGQNGNFAISALKTWKTDILY